MFIIIIIIIIIIIVLPFSFSTLIFLLYFSLLLFPHFPHFPPTFHYLVFNSNLFGTPKSWAALRTNTCAFSIGNSLLRCHGYGPCILQWRDVCL